MSPAISQSKRTDKRPITLSWSGSKLTPAARRRCLLAPAQRDPGQPTLIHPLACCEIEAAPNHLQTMIDGPNRNTMATPLFDPRLQDVQLVQGT
jgi:hypothetical protein